MTKCRNITCSELAVAYIRIQHTFKDGYKMDADWPYCQEHFNKHLDKLSPESRIFFPHYSMKGFRHDESTTD